MTDAKPQKHYQPLYFEAADCDVCGAEETAELKCEDGGFHRECSACGSYYAGGPELRLNKMLATDKHSRCPPLMPPDEVFNSQSNQIIRQSAEKALDGVRLLVQALYNAHVSVSGLVAERNALLEAKDGEPKT